MSNQVFTGVTTGSIATACSLSALKSILSNKTFDSVRIATPESFLDIIIDETELLPENTAVSTAHKYPYNDPDVTVNLKIKAKVQLTDIEGSNKILITGGNGIGKITKPGLQIPVGDWAINPVPREMIKNNLDPLIPEGKMVKVEIIIPDGEKIAKKTMNPKLGIVGGISVLGTTGIARSMSSKAYKDSIVSQIDVALASEIDNLIFVPGNIGEKLACEKLEVSSENIIQTGNYVGFMFEEAKKRGIDSFLFFGHIGKLIKVAGGIFNTKHSVADGRREILMAHASLNGAGEEVIKKLYESKTTEDMLDILSKVNLKVKVCNSLANAISERCKIRFDLDINVILVDMEGNYLNDNFEV